tara:strand:+ start:796 stop:948 length:153 start_codon:yes stop_codon:yes gene_type:complete
MKCASQRNPIPGFNDPKTELIRQQQQQQQQVRKITQVKPFMEAIERPTIV